MRLTLCRSKRGDLLGRVGSCEHPRSHCMCDRLTSGAISGVRVGKGKGYNQVRAAGQKSVKRVCSCIDCLKMVTIRQLTWFGYLDKYGVYNVNKTIDSRVIKLFSVTQGKQAGSLAYMTNVTLLAADSCWWWLCEHFYRIRVSVKQLKEPSILYDITSSQVSPFQVFSSWAGLLECALEQSASGSAPTLSLQVNIVRTFSTPYIRVYTTAHEDISVTISVNVFEVTSTYVTQSQ